MSFSIEEWVAIGSAVVAVVSLALNWVVVRQQIKLQFESLKAQLEEDVLAWAQEAIEVLSEGVALARGHVPGAPGDDPRRTANLVAQRLSALADRGRLFFPNELRSDFGAANPAAFQGLRPPIIDAMVFASCYMEALRGDGATPDPEAEACLRECRRLVVSEAQNAINPRRRKEILNRLIEGRKDDAQAPDEVVERIHAALAKRSPDSPVVKAWLESRPYARPAKAGSAAAPPPASPR